MKSLLRLNILLLQCNPSENILMGSPRGKRSYLAQVTHIIPTLTSSSAAISEDKHFLK